MTVNNRKLYDIQFTLEELEALQGRRARNYRNCYAVRLRGTSYVG